MPVRSARFEAEDEPLNVRICHCNEESLMEFYWEAKDDKWFLRPAVEAPEQAPITVEQEDWYWLVKIGGRPLNFRFTGLIGARQSAWEYVKRYSHMHYGIKSVTLRSIEEPSRSVS